MLLAVVTILATLAWITDGNFLRHIFLYNVNRLEPLNVILFGGLSAYFGYIYVVVRGALWRLYDCQPFPERGCQIFRVAQTSVCFVPRHRAFPVFSSFGLATLMLLMVLKSGAGIKFLC